MSTQNRRGGGMARRPAAFVAAGLAIAALALPRAAGAASACFGGSCTACAPAIPASFSTLIPAAAFTNAEFDVPIAFVSPDDGLPHRFVVTQEGGILVWEWDAETGTGSLLATPFLDIRSKVAFGGERGLLAMAVAPDYAASGTFYVYYTTEQNTATLNPGDIVVERYQRSAGNPNLADAGSATIVLSIDHDDATNHNGGWLAFGPDGYLYVSTGDGGGGCDSVGPGNGQNINALLGKVLRLDVSGSAATDCGDDGGRTTNYTIPGDNPFVGVAGCDEIWAYGLRNPFRFSFDRATGDLWIGDVGQDNWEEINFQSATLHDAPMNFGWVVREGCDVSGVSPSECGCSGPACPTANPSCQYPAPGAYWDPVFCHSNPGGWASIMGGYRYRGLRVPTLDGRYLYSDYNVAQIWVTTSFDPANLGAATACCLADRDFGVYAFGEDQNGELYVVNGSAKRVDCIHDGNPDGCFWAGFRGLFEDDFESEGTDHWHTTVSP